MSLTKVTYSMISGIGVNVLDYGADPTGVADSTSAINAAIAAAGSGGEVTFPNGTFKTTAFINAENLRGLTIKGCIGQYGFSGTQIIGSHTGKCILSLVGSLFCVVDGITLSGDTAATPKTSLLLGRSSSASSGSHSFYNVNINGYYSIAGLYNIASEDNCFYSCYILPNAAPFAGAYFSQADTQSIGGLTASSMEHNTFFGGNIGSADTTSGSTGLYIDCGAATGHIHFYSVFFLKGGGDSFIYMRLGAIDGLDTTFPIGFHDCAGEIINTAPTNGLHISSAQSRILSGFTATNIRFQTPSTNHILCDGAGSVRLIGANISTPQLTGSTITSTFMRVDQSSLSMLFEASITISDANSVCNTIVTNPLEFYTLATLTNSWVSTFGVSNGFFAPAYIKDQLGYVHLRGLANGGTVGQAIFTLPVGFRPYASCIYPVISNGVFGSLNVNSDGTVVLNAGSNMYVSLDGITFKTGAS